MSLALAGLQRWAQPRAQAALDYAHLAGVHVDLTSIYRSRDEQAELRRRWERCVARGHAYRTAACRWPANRPGDSAHQYGLAWDSWVPDRLMGWWVAVRRAFGWSVPDNDVIHAEVPNWRSLLGK